MARPMLLLTSGCLLFGCTPDPVPTPKTPGEINSGYIYIPVDPVEVTVLVNGQFPPGTTAKGMRRLRYGRCVARSTMDDPGDPVPAPADVHSADVMDALPDHTIRLGMRSVSGSGQGSFGPVTLSAEGTSYQVIMDSIFADTTNVRFAISVNGGKMPIHSLRGALPEDTDIRVVRLRHPSEPLSIPEKPEQGYEEVTMPVYIGIGLRLTASIYTAKGGINLSNLPAIAASADARESSGSLTMQTLGVYNQQVASTFALPTELSTTSVQSALVSMGAVKAIVYDRGTGTRPRLTGIYNPLGTSDPRLINKIYSALALRPIPWAPCGAS